ncbi:MAG: metallophosphoesterase family protein [Chloroflexi bacterium]|nr:metallophosphoesterase family protein [Chloroflexota bacterium]
MKLAILSDIHGNSLALDAVLADIQAQGGVDNVWLLGDYVAIGPDPVGVLERLSQLPPQTVFIRGNTDRYISNGDRPGPTLAEIEADTTLLERFKMMNEGFAWTQGMVTAAGWFDWLAALPLEQRLTLPDGRQALAVHASPGTDESWGLSPKSTDEQLRKLFGKCDADLVFVGHTHYAVERHVDGRHLVNPGSLSNPNTADKRANYILLHADPNGYTITYRQAAYDWQALLRQAEQIHYPSAPFLKWLFTRLDDQTP